MHHLSLVPSGPQAVRQPLTHMVPEGHHTTWAYNTQDESFTWEITLGVHSSAHQYLRALEEAGQKISPVAYDLFHQHEFVCEQKHRRIRLVAVRDIDLGFSPDSCYLHSQLCEQASLRGYDLCPPEAAAALRLVYTTQPYLEWLVVVSKSIHDSEGHPGIFAIGHDADGSWLIAPDGYPRRIWHAGMRFIFALK